MSEDLVAELQAVHRTFGSAARREKKRLLRALAGGAALDVGDLPELCAVLEFVRAHPDDAQVLALAREVIVGLRDRVAREPAELDDTGVPGSVCRYPYSYAVLQRLDRRFPGALEIDWDAFEDQTLLSSLLALCFTGPEGEANEYWPYAWPDFIERSGSRRSSDLGFFLRLLQTSGRSAVEQAALFEMCDIPIRYVLDQPGSGRPEVEVEAGEPFFQAEALPKERFELAPEIVRPLRLPRALSRARAERVLDACTAALASRSLEIHPLIYASPDDVLLVRFDRGVAVVLAGVLPEHRAPLGGSYFFMVLKNGVPAAYGPAAPLFGACELGINVFPEFRGGEIRFFYSQFMRLLHHAFGVELFHLTRYGMGEDNPDAIASGAFWFYRKLGFVPTSPAVEAMAREEEARMRREPGHRSDRKMLRRLSRTEAVLDLSARRRAPFDFGALGMAVSRDIAARHDGDRAAAVRTASARVRRALGVRDFSRWSADERAALERLSLVLDLVPDLASFGARAKSTLIRILRSKGSSSETVATRLLAQHARLEAALRAVARAAGDD
jgi:hypothetical protein